MYIGEWKTGFMDGYGTYCWGNGDVYEGGWKDGKRFGLGMLKLANGIIYAGAWEGDLCVMENGTVYKVDQPKKKNA
jgi:hypothetical protein